MNLTKEDKKQLELFYYYGGDFPFDDNNTDLVQLERVPNYIKNSELYKTLDSDTIIIEKRYYPIDTLDIDSNFYITFFNPKVFVSFLKRFEYWGADANWLFDSTKYEIKEIIKYIFKNREYLMKHTSNERMDGINSYFLNIINNFTFKSYEELITILYIRNVFIPDTMWTRDFREIITLNIEVLSEINYLDKDFVRECFLLRRYVDYTNELMWYINNIYYSPMLHRRWFLNKYFNSNEVHVDLYYLLDNCYKLLALIIKLFPPGYKMQKFSDYYEHKSFTKDDDEKYTIRDLGIFSIQQADGLLLERIMYSDFYGLLISI